MVFGNLGFDSGTGVVFTRNPSIGEKELYGEFLLNAQGEDLVSGVRTPEPISSLREKLPQIYNELVHICQVIEKHFRDMQDIEFTVEKGKLYILQTRSGKRTPQAAVKIAFDMYKEGILSKVEAAKIVRSVPLQELVIQQKDPNVKVEILAKGLPASPGVATGVVVFNSDETRRFKERGEKIILVRPQTSPEDIKGILAADGVLTIRGGMTSHAAVITRDLGKPCVVGCEEIKIDLEAEKFYVNKGAQNIIVSKGEIITVDGTTGYVILGEVPLIVQRLSDYVKELLA
jgi:pyruvate,orthophosphate dikinase